jgi:hypothetical protein
MNVSGADCVVNGTLSIAGEQATLSGQMCTATAAALALTSDLGRGSASAMLDGESLSGSFTVTITRPATSVFDPVPGTYSGVFDGGRSAQ